MAERLVDDERPVGGEISSRRGGGGGAGRAAEVARRRRRRRGTTGGGGASRRRRRRETTGRGRGNRGGRSVEAGFRVAAPPRRRSPREESPRGRRAGSTSAPPALPSRSSRPATCRASSRARTCQGTCWRCRVSVERPAVRRREHQPNRASNGRDREARGPTPRTSAEPCFERFRRRPAYVSMARE